MLKPCQTGVLKIVGKEDHDLLLENGDKTIKLYSKEVPKGGYELEEIEVTVFLDEEDEWFATTAAPTMQLGKLAALYPTGVTPKGAFFDIGLERDIFVPIQEQDKEVQNSRRAIITLQYNERMGRLFGSTRLKHFFTNDDIELEIGQVVEAMLVEKQPDGAEAILNNKNWGFLPKQDFIGNLQRGEVYKMYVKNIRGREVLLTQQPLGEAGVNKTKAHLMGYLESVGGYARLTPETPSEEINLRLKMSKQDFRKAVALLEEEDKIILTKRGVKLTKK